MNEENPVPELRDHIIVCGLGHVGVHCLGLLTRLGEPCLALARRAAEECRPPGELGAPVLCGDARDERLLREAGIERARAVIVVTGDDPVNVAVAFDAKRLNPRALVVVRLFDQDLAFHLEKTGKVDRALSASALAAPAFVAAALGGTVRSAFAVDGVPGFVEEFCVAPDSPWVGQTVRRWSEQTGLALPAVERGDAFFVHPDASQTLEPGDRLTTVSLSSLVRPGAPDASVVRRPHAKRRLLKPSTAVRIWWEGTPKALRAVLTALVAVVVFSVVLFHTAVGLPWVDSLYFVVTTITTVGFGDFNFQNYSPWMKLYGSFLMLCGAAILAVLFSLVTDLVVGLRLRDLLARGTSQFKDHLIVAGLGNIGFRLVRDLAHNGETVVAVEHREDGAFVPAARELVPVVLGNARTAETLARAGIAGAKAVIAATDDDLANLSTALIARRVNPDARIVLRMFNAKPAEYMQDDPALDAVLSVSASAAPTFVGSALCPDVLQGVMLPGGLMLLFHRSFGAGASSACACRPAALGEREFPLFVKPKGAAAFDVAPPDYAPREGDEILGARWCATAAERSR